MWTKLCEKWGEGGGGKKGTKIFHIQVRISYDECNQYVYPNCFISLIKIVIQDFLFLIYVLLIYIYLYMCINVYAFEITHVIIYIEKIKSYNKRKYVFLYRYKQWERLWERYDRSIEIS